MKQSSDILVKGFAIGTAIIAVASAFLIAVFLLLAEI